MKFFIDFDNTMVNSSKAFAEVYNKKYNSFPEFKKVDWRDIQEYDFRKTCTAIKTKEEVLDIFESEEFFIELEQFDGMRQTVEGLIDANHHLIVCTIGTSKNLNLKAKWISRKFGAIGIDMIGINPSQTGKMDKSLINMQGATMIDDNLECLDSSNAMFKLVFGKEVEYNKTSKYLRIKDWKQIARFI